MIAVESSGHLADVADVVMNGNGCGGKAHVIHKDARFLQLIKADARGRLRGDIQRPVDLMVFEVRPGSPVCKIDVTDRPPSRSTQRPAPRAQVTHSSRTAVPTLRTCTLCCPEHA